MSDDELYEAVKERIQESPEFYERLQALLDAKFLWEFINE